jgi:hypothetical protein
VIVAVDVGTFEQPFALTRLVKLTTLLPATRLPAGIVIVPPLERFVKLTVLPFTDSEPEKGEVPAVEVNVTELAVP